MEFDALVYRLIAEAESNGVDAAASALRRAGEQAQNAQKKFEAFADRAEKAGKKLSSIGKTLTTALTLPIVGAATLWTKAAIDFEDAFAGVRKTIDATEREYADMSREIINMSNRMPFAAKEIAGVVEAAGQLGIARKDAIAFSETMLKLGQATDLAGEEAATSLARFANITGMDPKKYDNLGSAIVALGNNFAATESEIVSLGMRLAAAGNQVGLSEAEIMSFSAALRSVGVEAEAGGTAFSKVMLDMDVAVAKGGQALKGYADVSGMTAKGFAKLWKEDAASALAQFIQGLGNAQKEGKNLAVVLEKLGYTEVRTRDALMRSAGASGDVAKAVRMANDAWEQNVALQEEVDKRNATMASRLEVLKNKLTNAGMAAVGGLMPFIEKGMTAIGGLIDQFAALDEGARRNLLFGGLSLAAIGPTISVIGKITKAVGSLSKAFTFLSAHPVVLAIGAIVAAGAGLIALLNALDNRTEKMAARVSGLAVKVDEEQIQQALNGVQAGREAYDLFITARVEAEVETDKVWDKTVKALENGVISGSEARGITNALNKTVDADIKAAQKYLDEESAKFVTHLQTYTVGNSTDILAGDFAFVQQVKDIVKGIGAQLREIDPSLTDADIDTIVKIALTTPLADLERKLGEAGFTDVDLVSAVTSNIQPQITALNGIFENLGIADEGTRAKMVETVTANMGEMAKDLKKLGIKDDGTQGAIVEALGNAFGDMKTAVNTLKDKEGFALSDTDINSLVLAWIGGPDKWNAELKKQKITDDSTVADLETVLGQFADPLAEVDLAGADRGKVVGAWSKQFGDILVEAANMTLLSEETQQQLAASLGEKTRGIMEQISRYRDDYNELVSTISREGRSASEAELLRMQELLDKIATLKAELSMLGEEAYQRAQTARTLVAAGKADPEQFGTAAGFEDERFKRKQDAIKAQYTETLRLANEVEAKAKEALDAAQARLAEVQGTDLEAIAQVDYRNAKQTHDAAVDYLAKLTGDEKVLLENAKQEYAATIMQMFNDMAAQFPDMAKVLEGVTKDYDLLAILLGGGLKEISPEDAQKYWNEILGGLSELSSGTLEQIFQKEGVTAQELSPVDFLNIKWDTMDPKMMDDIFGAEGTLASIIARGLQEKIIEALQGEEMGEGRNLLATLFKSLLDSDVDLSSIDASNLTGALEGFLKAEDFLASMGEGGQGISKAVLDGTAKGMKDNEALGTDAVSNMGQALIDEFATKLDSHSPSRVFEEFGKNIDKGVEKGIDEYASLAEAALTRLADKMRLGGMGLVQGLINGIQSMRGPAISALSSLLSTMMAMVSSAVASMQAMLASVSASAEIAVASAPTAQSSSSSGSSRATTVINQEVNINAPQSDTLKSMARAARKLAEGMAPV